MPVVTLPDGSQRRFDQPVSVDEIAGSIGAGLRKAALAAIGQSDDRHQIARVKIMVGASGIEPPTTTMSRWCSTTELRAYMRAGDDTRGARVTQAKLKPSKYLRSDVVQLCQRRSGRRFPRPDNAFHEVETLGEGNYRAGCASGGQALLSTLQIGYSAPQPH